MSEPIKSNYAHTLNALSSMQGALCYAARKVTLAEAERAIVELEELLSASKAREAELREKLGCSNHDCKSSRQCWRFLRGIGDGGFEPFLHEDRCDWFKPAAHSAEHL